MTSIKNKFSKGMNTILSPNLVNLFIVLSLIIILLLSYLKYNKIELYEENTATSKTIAQIFYDTDTGYIESIIKKYLYNNQTSNAMKEKLNIREKKIQDISLDINNLFF